MSQEHKYVTLRVQVRLLRKGVNAYVASFVFFKMDNLSWALKDEFWEQRPFSKSQVQRFLSLHWLHFLPSTMPELLEQQQQITSDSNERESRGAAVANCHLHSRPHDS